MLKAAALLATAPPQQADEIAAEKNRAVAAARNAEIRCGAVHGPGLAGTGILILHGVQLKPKGMAGTGHAWQHVRWGCTQQPSRVG